MKTRSIVVSLYNIADPKRLSLPPEAALDRFGVPTLDWIDTAIPEKQDSPC